MKETIYFTPIPNMKDVIVFYLILDKAATLSGVSIYTYASISVCVSVMVTVYSCVTLSLLNLSVPDVSHFEMCLKLSLGYIYHFSLVKVKKYMYCNMQTI